MAGQSWTEYTGTAPAAYKTLLVRQSADAKSLEIMAGSAPMSELQNLASALKGRAEAVSGGRLWPP